MSASLYNVRLYWDGKTGLAKIDGVVVLLQAAPALAALPRVAGIDYAPEARVEQVREYTQAWRDMTRDEAAACHALLTRMAAAARATFNLTPSPEPADAAPHA